MRTYHLWALSSEVVERSSGRYGDPASHPQLEYDITRCREILQSANPMPKPSHRARAGHPGSPSAASYRFGLQCAWLGFCARSAAVTLLCIVSEQRKPFFPYFHRRGISKGRGYRMPKGVRHLEQDADELDCQYHSSPDAVRPQTPIIYLGHALNNFDVNPAEVFAYMQCWLLGRSG